MGACELKRQAKLEQWKTQVIDCRSSGMSVRGWCADHNISAKTYKRLEQGAYQWPRTENEVRQLTPQQYRWLMEGLKVEQLKAHRPVDGLRII